MRCGSTAQADSKFQTQGASLRRALADELRDCVRTSLGPRMDRALNDALEAMEHAVCIGVERMNAEVMRSSGIVTDMAERHEQVGARSMQVISCWLTLQLQMLAELAEFASERASGNSSRAVKVGCSCIGSIA